MAAQRTMLPLLLIAAVASCINAFPGPAGFEMNSGQAVYRLPQDHAMHWAADFYKTNDMMEWYYFTSFVKDLKTGEPLTLFWTLNAQGYVAKNDLPFFSTLFSAHNMETGFFQNTIDFPNNFANSGRTGMTVKNNDFGFTYIAKDDNSFGNVTYEKKTETWYFYAKSSETDDGSAPYEIDLTLKTYSPGYIPATPFGIETEGYNKDGDWNPETAYGLSYYITAPQLVISGTATLGDGKGKRTVRGTAWMEHQWGNFRGYSNLHSRYQWAWARLDNGDLMTYRQWHAHDGQDKENGPADLTQNRYIYLRKLEGGKYATEYAWGPSIKYTVAKQHTLANGQKIPLWAKLETPQGTFYLAPEFPNQQAKTAVGLYFWEGVKYLYTDPKLTKRVGRMFGEFFEIPNKKFNFVRQRKATNLARPLDGGFPDIPADAVVPLYPNRQVKNLFKFSN